MAKQANAITVDTFGEVLTLTFSNGKELSVNTATLAPEIVKQALMHGLKQKLVDAAAISRNPETGASATVNDKFEAVRAVYDRLTHATNPTWNKGRDASTGKKQTNDELLAQALVNLSNGKQTLEYVTQFLESKTKLEKKALANNPKVAAEIARLKGSENSGDDILGELLGTDDGDGVDVETDETDETEEEDEEEDESPAPAPVKTVAKKGSKKAAAIVE